MTLIHDSTFLTEQLTASVSYERITTVSIPNMERAIRYLNAAAEAARRYANSIKMVEEYKEAWRQPWVLILTKKELLSMAMRNKAQHESFMNFYKQILLKEITK